MPNIKGIINDEVDEKVDYGYDLDDLDQEISESEVRFAIKNLKNNKAAGLDGVSSEFLKSADEIIVPFLTKLFNKMFDTGYFPDQKNGVNRLLCLYTKKVITTIQIIIGALMLPARFLLQLLMGVYINGQKMKTKFVKNRLVFGFS